MANVLWGELNRRTERPISVARSPARAVWPRRTVGIGALVVAVIALGAGVTRYHVQVPPSLPPVVRAVQAAQAPPAPAAGVPEPAPVERSVEVVVVPPAPPLEPRTAPRSPEQPAVKSTLPVTPVRTLVAPRGTPSEPAPPAARTPMLATPEIAQDTPRVQVAAPQASARVTPSPSAIAESAEAPRVPVSSAPERGSSPDPSAIIDWLLKEYPRQQR